MRGELPERKAMASPAGIATLGIVVLLALYVASFGPANRYTSWHPATRGVFFWTFYAPVVRMCEQHRTILSACHRYNDLWYHGPFAP